MSKIDPNVLSCFLKAHRGVEIVMFDLTESLAWT